MVMSFLGLRSQSMLTRRCEGFSPHQFSTLCHLPLTPFSCLSVLSDYSSSIMLSIRFSYYSGLSIIHAVLLRLNKEAKPRL